MQNYLEIFRDGLRFFSAPVWRFEGVESNSGARLSTLVSGPEKQLEYVLYRIYGDGAVEKAYLGRKPVPAIGEMLRRTNCSLAVVAAPRYALSAIRKPGDICIPWWIDSEIECDPILGSGNTRSLKSDLRKIRTNGLSYTIANTADDLSFFYRHIYEPSIRASHGNSALMSSPRKRLRQLAKKMAHLLLVKSGSNTVGGLLIDFRKHTPAYRDVGVLEGDPQLMKLGVVSAAAYFGVEYLKSIGHHNFRMGLSRCFLDDGALTYKRKWRPTFVCPSTNGFLFRVRELNAASRSLFLSTECITTIRGRLFRTSFESAAINTGSTAGKTGRISVLKGIERTIRYDVSGRLPVRLATN